MADRVTEVVKPLLVYPSPLASDHAQQLRNAGYELVTITTERDISPHVEAWAGAIVAADINADQAWRICETLRGHDDSRPIIVLIDARQLESLTDNDLWFDDFCLVPASPHELEARLGRAIRVASGLTSDQQVSYQELVLNVETYQASIAGEPLDLTHMEYELLRFLASSPGKVFSREVLLSQVWGYEYFGGARTVDVHIRRLRSKLGEPHAAMIQTVRSVGYSLG